MRIEEVPTWRAVPPRDFLSRFWNLGGVALTVHSNDVALFDEVATTFGPAAQQAGRSAAALDVIVDAGSASGDHGVADFRADDVDALTPDDMLLGLSSNTFPFTRHEAAGGAVAFAFEGDTQPLFSFEGEGERCVFWKRDRWRSALAFLLIHRVYRLRRDAIFFHAASLVIGGRGMMIVGPKGAGKSTTALALAARGVPLLGDEMACWVPSTNMLEAFCRPVGIKPGPKADAVVRGLERAGLPRDGEIVRVPVARLFEVAPVAPAPLGIVLFLGPFATEPALTPMTAGRDTLVLLQPATSSLVNAPQMKRVMEMARLLAGSEVYRLTPGSPDATADFLIDKFGGSVS